MSNTNDRLQLRDDGHVLVVLNGPFAGATVTLEVGGRPVSIGRDRSRELPLDDPLASRLHCRVWHDGQHWQIEDCGSSNGTKVNAQFVERTVLETGDLIRVGDRLIVFLQQSDSIEQAAWGPSLVADTTAVVRVSREDRAARLAGMLDSDDADASHRYLPVLYRVATMLHEQTSAATLCKNIARTACQAIEAGQVNVWMTDTSGRLRRMSSALRDKCPDRSSHLLASVAMERDEAILIGSGDEVAVGERRTEEMGMAVPIPGRGGVRGAIECFHPAEGRWFGGRDLEFLMAVSHQLGLALENIEHREKLERANDNLRIQLGDRRRIIGDSMAVKQLTQQLHRIAPTTSTVLLLGESGTGKELASQMIHELSPRGAGPFVAVNCAAFNESLLESELFGHEEGAFTGAQSRRLGQFERAHRGTIFLDEVGEMSLACQAKLLRILEGHRFERVGGVESIGVDVRIVAATNRDLKQMVDAGEFRDDLYYRLRVIEVSLPPLRERGDDILLLAEMFLVEFRQKTGHGPVRFSTQAIEAIRHYAWPGNVRELRNAVERAVVLACGDEVGIGDLAILQDPSSVQRHGLISLADAERRHIEYVLHRCDGNKTQACRILRIGRGTLYSKLREVE
ncbi:MAG: sigma 54-interacting transcriptional regulator [Pirellulaceae bacterium]|nr:sigma 54-interacting transcriptional regulator [Planctomycetales bacterium]